MAQKMNGHEQKTRLFSLDLLRGLDIFLLTAIGPLVWAIHRTWGDYDSPAWWLDLVKHPAFGFSPWDIIMPLFLFMSGAAIPLGFSRRLNADGRPTRAFWIHLAKRFSMLWVLSVFTHGGLCSLDPMRINPFAGALLVIGVAMVFVSLWMLVLPWRVRLAIPVAIFVGYALSMHLWGDYTLEGNLAWRADLLFRSWLLPAGHTAVAPKGMVCAYFLSVLIYAGVLAPAGALAVEYVRSGGASGTRKALTLAGVGFALLALGWALTPWVPMAKRMMSASFTLAALGWCLLALAACYYLTDVKGWRRGLWIFTLYGQCSLVAYVIDEQFRAPFREAAKPFIIGFPQWFGPKYQEMFLWVFMIAIQTGFLYLWRKARMAK